MTRRRADECAPASQPVGLAAADGWSARGRSAVGSAAAVGTAAGAAAAPGGKGKWIFGGIAVLR